MISRKVSIITITAFKGEVYKKRINILLGPSKMFGGVLLSSKAKLEYPISGWSVHAFAGEKSVFVLSRAGCN